ncbi:hypothetical protein Tco_0990192 [Tanacetum coccineum]|uniref:Uncharacterized protein n=1 Tax=Tanacetum coccineum TaxID=301880 RepID=A0ABQ5EVT7_9ASTR
MGKIKGQTSIKGLDGQFRSSLTQMQGQISLIKGILNLSQALDTSSMEEAQVYMGFCTKSLSKEAQVSLKAIRVRSLIDPTAKIFDLMIMTMSGED